MYISRLQLTQFRIYEALDLDFSPHINCIYGQNGSGKTNILDALHFLAFTRGFRSSKDKQAIKQGENFFLVDGSLQISDRTHSLQCNYLQGKGKKIFVNRQQLTKMSEHIGFLPLVAILPNDTHLINGPSADRRKFLDMLIAQYDANFLHHLIQYERVLAQRNALLKHFGAERYFDEEQLSLWDDQLIVHGRAIYKMRQSFLEDYGPVFTQYFDKIVDAPEQPKLSYRSQLAENTEAAWQQLLQSYRDKDRINQYSGAGIHRDDLVFGIDERSVRHFGSQGQQKTFVIALKLAQYKILEEKSGKTPLLLLDDIFDKLDHRRLAHISQILEQDIEGQVFITDTSLERLQKVFSERKEKQTSFFAVEAGVARETPLA